MANWEVKVEHVHACNNEDLQDELNKSCSGGWEPVSQIYEKDDFWVCTFKRQAGRMKVTNEGKASRT